MEVSRRTAALLTVCYCFLALAAAPRAEAKAHRPGDRQRRKQQIENLEEQWRAAFLSTNLALMDKLMSEDYVGISMTGEISTKTMQMDRLRASRLVISKLDLSDMKVKLLGRVAIVTSLADVVGTANGQPIEGHFRYTRVYQRLAPGVWKTTNFEATRLSRFGNHKQWSDEASSKSGTGSAQKR